MRLEAKSRKYQGVFKAKSRVEISQVRGIWSQQFEHKQVPKGGRNQMSGRVSVLCWLATPVGVMKLVESLIGWEDTVGQGSECHLTFVRRLLHIAE